MGSAVPPYKPGPSYAPHRCTCSRTAVSDVRTYRNQTCLGFLCLTQRLDRRVNTMRSLPCLQCVLLDLFISEPGFLAGFYFDPSPRLYRPVLSAEDLGLESSTLNLLPHLQWTRTSSCPQCSVSCSSFRGYRKLFGAQYFCTILYSVLR